MRLLRLVNNLLDFSRLEAGKSKAKYQLTDIAAYTENIASSFRSVIENAGLELNVHCNRINEPVYVDKEMWGKILLNLLSNAFKYTFKGSITVSVYFENKNVLLKVKDTGVGIPEAELPNMFQRFHRVQNVVGRTYEGTGIGLSLVKELVQLHGGEISVSSKLNEGSEFTISIPARKEHVPADAIIEKEVALKAEIINVFIEEAASLIKLPLAENGNRLAPDSFKKIMLLTKLQF